METAMSIRHKGFSLLEALIVVAITLVAAAIATPKLLGVMKQYRMTDSVRRLQALATAAHVKSSARNTRYQILVVSSTTFKLQYCTDCVASRSASGACSAWALDESSALESLAAGITFSTSGLSSVDAPAIVTCDTTPCAVSQASEMTFNSRGLLFDESASAPTASRCFYLAGTSVNSMAVCTSLTGKTAIYSLSGSTWTRL